MHKKLRMAVVAALLVTSRWGASAAATSEDSCDRNGKNAAGCDLDSDGTINKDDTDDDGDGIADEDEIEGCERDADEACGAEGGGGETPALPLDPADVVAQVEAVVDEVVAQLPAAPGDEEPPSEEPPSEEPPADPTAEIQAIVDEAVGQLPAPPADPAAEVQAAVEALVGQLPTPPAP